jgi:hypothetical protein
MSQLKGTSALQGREDVSGDFRCIDCILRKWCDDYDPPRRVPSRDWRRRHRAKLYPHYFREHLPGRKKDMDTTLYPFDFWDPFVFWEAE